MEMMPNPPTPELQIPDFIIDAIKDKNDVKEQLHALVEDALRHERPPQRRPLEGGPGYSGWSTGASGRRQ